MGGIQWKNREIGDFNWIWCFWGILAIFAILGAQNAGPGSMEIQPIWENFLAGQASWKISAEIFWKIYRENILEKTSRLACGAYWEGGIREMAARPLNESLRSVYAIYGCGIHGWCELFDILLFCYFVQQNNKITK